MKQNLLGALCLSLAASIWGGTFVVSKYVLDFIPPFTLLWIRYFIAFAVLFFLKKLNPNENIKKPTKRDWLLIGWLGFIGYFVSIALQFIGTKLSNAHTGALITSATPAFMVIFAKIVLNEKLTFKKIISLFIATIGVITVIGWDQNLSNYVWGCFILIGAAITWALLSVYVKIAAKRISSLTITTYAIFFALLFTTPAMVWELSTNSIHAGGVYILFGVLYLGVVSTAGAFFLWNKGLELMDAGIGSLFFFFQPVVGTFLGWLLLHEELSSSFFIGGAFILASVLIATVQKRSNMFITKKKRDQVEQF